MRIGNSDGSRVRRINVRKCGAHRSLYCARKVSAVGSRNARRTGKAVATSATTVNTSAAVQYAMGFHPRAHPC